MPHIQVVGEARQLEALEESVRVSKQNPGPGAATKRTAHNTTVEPFWSVPILRPRESIEVTVDVVLKGAAFQINLSHLRMADVWVGLDW